MRTVQEIIADESKKDMNSWYYKLPKYAPEEVVVKYRRLLELRRFCPLCKKICMRRGSENAKWKIVGEHSSIHGKRGRPKRRVSYLRAEPEGRGGGVTNILIHWRHL